MLLGAFMGPAYCDSEKVATGTISVTVSSATFSTGLETDFLMRLDMVVSLSLFMATIIADLASVSETDRTCGRKDFVPSGRFQSVSALERTVHMRSSAQARGVGDCRMKAA